MSTAHAAGRQWRVFFSYTAWSVVLILVLYPASLLAYTGVGPSVILADHPVVVVLIAAQIALGAWSAWRALAAWSRTAGPAVRGPWDLPRVGRLPSDWTLAATAALSVVIVASVLLAEAEPRLLIVPLVLLAGTVCLRWPWGVGIIIAIIVSLVAATLGLPPRAALVCGGFTVIAVFTFRSSLWLAAMVRELDEARQSQSRLAVAEERLRFARDLHDVTGRDLSVIAVKSELVAQLAEREDPRAVEHGREVAQIARASLAEIRGLVRGYREADLAAELRGTISLLRSAQVQVEVEGDVSDLPAEHADSAAWVLREGGTNILRHADPTKVTITLGADGLRLVNDGVPTGGQVVEGDGLTGMRERLGDRASLVVHRDGGTFTLDVRYDDAGGRHD
ncbi:sensor histidine kinase [Brachybacterium sp. GCM10030267]|uniref:sensor histidine kinase n=1 Tax=Brachybacterium sp. GCM10030267 TaxID=3273381 RepID=UPI003611C018